MIKDDKAYIDHILDCIRKKNEFSKGLYVTVASKTIHQDIPMLEKLINEIEK